jgi:M3 family oligoendopeptidase
MPHPAPYSRHPRHEKDVNATKIPHFSEMNVAAPDAAELARRFAALDAKFAAATSAADLLGAIDAWDVERRSLSTWRNLAHLHFTQDTRDAAARAAREQMEELWPSVTAHEVRVKRMLLEHPRRDELEAALGATVFAKWKSDIATFDPVIEADLVEESKLDAAYTELLASAQIEFDGATHNLSSLLRFMQDPDRAVREESTRRYWGFFADNRAELDRIFDEQVKLRTSMARKLGFADYRPLGYLRMQRLDYGVAEVEKFREQIREFVVPLAAELRKRQAGALGVSPLMFWDETVFDPKGNAAPKGDHDWMVARATEMFDSLEPQMGEFFRMLVDRGLLDLKSREGKAGGGFCTDVTDWGAPFVFANFNGTKGDVVVFAHEMGHAFQGWMSRNHRLIDELWPTMESAEIHSMSLEFITWPHMDRFFGEDAARYRHTHLAENILFLPYGVAVDHFQHMVYAEPDASPARRHEMWKEIESIYLPWRNYGDLPHLPMGGAWQRQGHIYGAPFYYIDYTLALTCALQFWVRTEEDPETAMRDYVALCTRGGEATFTELCRSAGLVPPFEAGAVERIVARAKRELGVP